ncbi:LCP family protein [Holdemanella porci]|uniref:LCP family protein n=1 Tax=Holdemanella porci TaxID=2652276 RepID=UPI001D1358E1|nr:LCP family protein [Holdemanella porci]MCC3360537.1 LCP family protein [Holdemanella porci]
MSRQENKKTIGFIIFAIILSVILVVFTGGLVYQIFKLQILPDNILIPIILVLILLTLIFVLLINFSTHGLVSKILCSLMVVVLSAVYGLGNYYLYSTNTTLETVTDQGNKAKNTVSVVVLNSSGLENVKSLEGSKLGVLKTIGNEATKKSLTDLKKYNVTYTKKTYDNMLGMLKALYDGEVDAIVLNEAYRSNVCDLEDYTNFNNDTKVIHKTVYYTKENSSSLAVSDITSKPFNILISGNDSFGSLDENSRSDVDMLVTINPVTSTILLTSIPRDSYVKEVCNDYACNYGVYDKLTHTGIYGVDTTKDTIENLLDIDINYVYRVNFTSMIDIVDALGGVDVTVPEGMAVSKFYTNSNLEGVHEGENHLDGKRALAYSRERKAYLDGDLQRARNQQQVLQAMFKKATSPEIIKNYTSLLKALIGAFDTNMTTKEITSFIKYQIQAKPSWKFEQFVLKGDNDLKMSAELGSEVSVVILYDSYINIAHDKIQAVLDGKSSDTVEADDDVPAGTLSEEEIEAQIQYGLMTEAPIDEEGSEIYYGTGN